MIHFAHSFRHGFESVVISFAKTEPVSGFGLRFGSQK